MVYRNVEISISEVESFAISNPETGSDYTVTNSTGVVYVATTKFGQAFATNTIDAVKVAQRLIDSHL